MAVSTSKRFVEGPLSKWTNVVNGWQYRWFVLDQNSGLLSYYTVSGWVEGEGEGAWGRERERENVCVLEEGREREGERDRGREGEKPYKLL